MKLRPVLRSLRPVLVILIAIWAVELVNWATGHRLIPWLGLRPRSLSGLIGVPLMPFLHVSPDHALANTVPLAFLGALGTIVARRRFVTATVVIVLVSGLAVWLLARPNSIHVGASGLVFGWFGYLVALGFLEGGMRAITGSIIVIGAYGGMLWGVVPQWSLPVSWEAHLFGALAGVAMAWLQGRRRGRRRR